MVYLDGEREDFSVVQHQSTEAQHIFRTTDGRTITFEKAGLKSCKMLTFTPFSVGGSEPDPDLN